MGKNKNLRLIHRVEGEHKFQFFLLFFYYLQMSKWLKHNITILQYDSFSDKVAHEVTQCEKNPNPYVLGTSLPYS